MGRSFRRWKPKGKMYSLRCTQCGEGFLSSYALDAPICGKCIQKAKSLDSTIEHEKACVAVAITESYTERNIVIHATLASEERMITENNKIHSQ